MAVVEQRGQGGVFLAGGEPAGGAGGVPPVAGGAPLAVGGVPFVVGGGWPVAGGSFLFFFSVLTPADFFDGAVCPTICLALTTSTDKLRR